MGKPLLVKVDDELHIDLQPCSGYEFTDAKDQIKEISGRRFDWDTKNWIVPATPDIADRLFRTIYPDADQALVDWVMESKASAATDLTTRLPTDAKLLVPWGHKRMEWQPEAVNDEQFDGLIDYQRSAVDLMARAQRVVLGDDMGLGKTLTALSAVEEWILRNPRPDGLPTEAPRLIVAPNSVTGGWVREITRWLPDGTPHQVVDSKTPAKRHTQMAEAIAQNAWVIVNWEQLRVKKVKRELRNGGTKTETVMKEPLFEDTEWLAVIADEVHKAKSRKAQQTMGLWRIQAPVMFGLTGTAVMNSPDELWSILRWLWPDDFHERGSAYKPGAQAYWTFYNEYVEWYEDYNKRKVITGVKNADALRFVLRDRIIRRTAKEALGDRIKGRRRIYFPLDLNPGQQKFYNDAETAIWLKIMQDAKEGDHVAADLVALAAGGATTAEAALKIPNGAARFVRLQQILESPALLGGPDDSAILDDLEEKIADSTPEPWVVFVKHVETCNLIEERLSHKLGLTVAKYNGTVDTHERTKIEDAFQRGEIDVVVGTIPAMYQGITLTRGSLQYWVSRDVVPDINEQGEARNDRLGQQELVRVYIPQPPGTVSADKVEIINRRKERTVRAILPKDAIQEVQL